jgi:glycosyltransferase involved in cell wall biosynthesis
VNEESIFLNSGIGTGISIVVCAKNRTNNLFVSLDSWLKIKQISEIIILDFGSDTPIEIPSKDSRINLYRYESEYWHLSKAYNIAIQLASKSIILKLDADHWLNKNFLDYHRIDERCFYAGHGGPLTGSLMLHKSNFLLVNGYNERIVDYGADDGDMYNRLSRNLKLKRRKMNYKFITHLHHENHERFRHQPNKIKESHGKRNYRIANKYPWTIEDKMTHFYDN